MGAYAENLGENSHENDQDFLEKCRFLWERGGGKVKSKSEGQSDVGFSFTTLISMRLLFSWRGKSSDSISSNTHCTNKPKKVCHVVWKQRDWSRCGWFWIFWFESGSPRMLVPEVQSMFRSPRRGDSHFRLHGDKQGINSVNNLQLSYSNESKWSVESWCKHFPPSGATSVGHLSVKGWAGRGESPTHDSTTETSFGVLFWSGRPTKGNDDDDDF